ncbi:MAG TPA: GntR family transcriptional regulator [Chloroflexota bacterium]|nr:GntR family transcriptional regulator [Chloroflexota bacterium]
MANRQTSARHLRELLVHRIASGQYTIGSQLPGTRELAVDVGANRNTVAKVYGELAREGLLQIVAGRGAFVVGRVDAAIGQEPIEQVTRLLDDAINRARLFGLAQADLVRLSEERIRAGYEDGTPRVSFVECNPYDARLASGELATQLGMPVRSLLYTDIPPSGPIETDIAATSFFHLAEVDRMLNGRGARVIGVNMLPDSDALLALARLKEGTRVGIVAANESGVERFSFLVRTYCRAEIRSLITPTDESLDELVPWTDVLVSSLSCALQVQAHAAGRQVIVIAFHVDPQSAQYLRSKILTTPAVG